MDLCRICREEMRYTLLILCMLAIPLAAAVPAQIINASTVTFESQFIDAQNYTRANAYIPATIEFTINESYNLFYLRLGTLNDRNEDVLVNRVTCGNPCKKNIEIKLLPSTTAAFVDTQFSIVAENGDTQTLNKRFRVDTTRPALRSIGTETCDENCAVHTGPNRIVAYFQESGSGMDPSTVFLLTPAPVGAQNCTQNTCTFVMSMGNEDEIDLTVNTARDRAGNSLSNNLTTTFIVDNDAPVIESFTTNPDRGNVVTGPFELRVLFSDVTAVSAVAELTGFNTTPYSINLTCSAERCTGRVTPKSGTYDASVKITLWDAAGNNATAEREFSVARTSTTATDLWAVGGTITPSRLDKGTAKLFSKKFFIPLTYSVNDGFPERRYVNVENCFFFSNGRELTDPLLGSKMLGAAASAPTIEVTLDPSTQSIEALDDYSGDLRIRCIVQTFSTVDGLYYERGEKDNVTVSITLMETPLVNAQYDQLLATAQEDYAHGVEQLQNWQRIYRYGFTFCGAIQIARGAEATTAAGANVASRSPDPVSQGVATGLDQTTRGLDRVGNALDSNPMGHRLCAAISCQDGGFFLSESSMNNFIAPLSGHSNPLSKTFDYAANLTGSQYSFVDPYKSEYIAYASACIPAIIHHAQTKLSFTCMYRDCLREQVPSGLPISACAAQQSNQLCRYTSGALFYASPLAPFQIMRDNFITIVGNPYALGGYLSPLLCDALGSTPLKAVCRLPRAIQQFAGIKGLVNSMQQYGAMLGSTPDDAIPQTCRVPTEPIDPLTRRLAQDVQCNVASCCYGGYCMYGGNYYRVTTRSDTVGTIDTEIESEAVGRTLERSSTRDVPSNVKSVLGDADAQRRATYRDHEYERVLGEIIDEQEAIQRDRTDLRKRERDLNQALRRNGAIGRATSCTGQTRQACYDTFISQVEAAGGKLTPQQQADLRQAIVTGPTEDRIAADTYNRFEQAKEAMGDALPPEPGEWEDELWAQAEHDAREAAASAVLNEQEARQTQTALGQAASTATEAAFEQFDEEAGRIDTREKETRDRRAQAERDAYARRLDDKTFLISEMSTTGIAAFQVASMFGQNHVGTVFGNIEELDEEIPSLEREIADRYCTERIIRRQPSIVGLSEGQTIGMYLHGTRTEVADTIFEGDLSEENQYEYLVGGQISIPDATEGTFELYLKGDSDTESLFEGNFAQRATYSWADASLFAIGSNKTFTHACTKFSRPLADLFAVTYYEGDTICVALQEIRE